MFNGNSRWYGLTLLAVCNLVLWVAIAALVGLLVSDEVDLGLETELRRVQATLVVAWDRLSEGEPSLADRPASPGREPNPTATRPYKPQAAPATSVAWSERELFPTEVPAAAVSPAGSATGHERGSGESRPTASPAVAGSLPPETAGPVVATALPDGTSTNTGQGKAASGQANVSGAVLVAPVPTQALLSKPLLLADPEFHNLAGLNAELARSASGRVVQIRYQEEALNRELSLMCQNNPDLPFRSIQVDLKRDRVDLSGEISVLGFQVDAWVTGTVVARDCRPQIEIESVAVAGVLTPQFVRDQVEREVLEAMAWYPADYPLCLEQIVLEETRATIYGYHR